MSLTKDTTAQVIQASASNAAGATTTGASVLTGYGIGIIATITNGATGPTAGCDAVLEVSCDNSTFYEKDRRTAGPANNLVTPFSWDLGVAGGGADWKYARIKFVGNTVQAVTVQAVAASTTAF